METYVAVGVDSFHSVGVGALVDDLIFAGEGSVAFGWAAAGRHRWSTGGKNGPEVRIAEGRGFYGSALSPGDPLQGGTRPATFSELVVTAEVACVGLFEMPYPGAPVGCCAVDVTASIRGQGVLVALRAARDAAVRRSAREAVPKGSRLSTGYGAEACNQEAVAKLSLLRRAVAEGDMSEERSSAHVRVGDPDRKGRLR